MKLVKVNVGIFLVSGCHCSQYFLNQSEHRIGMPDVQLLLVTKEQLGLGWAWPMINIGVK